MGHCPACTEPHQHEEKVGEIAVCRHCGTIMRRDHHLNLVALSLEECAALSPREKIRALILNDLARLSAYGKLGGSGK